MLIKPIVSSYEVKKTPVRKFRKLDGSKVDPATVRYDSASNLTFINVEGEGVMTAITGDVYLLGNVDPVKKMVSQTEEETNNYERWKYGYTNFGTDPSLTRVEKPKHRYYLDTTGRRRRKKNVVVGKVHWCTLVAGDTWGKHEATKELYRGRTHRATLERDGNTRHDGRPVYLAYERYPDPWDATLSSQRALEGCENSARPPTVVELLAPVLIKGSVFRYSKDKVLITKAASKPVPAAPTWDDSPVERKDLDKYGSAVNDEHVDMEACYPSDRKIEARMIVRKGMRPLSKLIDIEGDIEDGIHVSTWEYDYLSFYHVSPRNFDEARYRSWLFVPDVMRNALLTDRYNHHIASKSVQEKFDRRFPINLMNDDALEDDSYRLSLYWAKVSRGTEENRYLEAQLSASVHNMRLKSRPPLHLDKEMSARNRALAIVEYRWERGKITTAKYKSLVRSFGGDKEAAVRPSESRALVLVSDVWESYSREEKQFMMTFGAQPWEHSYTEAMLKRRPLLPMSDMEYEAVTRPEWSNEAVILEGEYLPKVGPAKPSFSFEEAFLEDFSAFDYSPIIVDEADRKSTEAMKRHRNRAMSAQGVIEIGDAYGLDEESGIILPNFSSKQLEVIIEHVSQ